MSNAEDVAGCGFFMFVMLPITVVWVAFLVKVFLWVIG